MAVDDVAFGSPAADAGFDWDFVIVTVRVPREQYPKEIIFLPALAIAVGIYFLQRQRQTRKGAAEAAA